MSFLWARDFTPNQPPYFMLRDQMAKTAQLSDFDEELYKVSESKDKPELDKYLIATSEQPLSVLHSEEWLDQALPIKVRCASFQELTCADPTLVRRILHELPERGRLPR
jgi:seryl-tRNA synthetase